MIIDTLREGDTITFTYTRTTARDGRDSAPTTRTGTVREIRMTGKGVRVWIYCEGDPHDAGKQYNPDAMSDVMVQ